MRDLAMWGRGEGEKNEGKGTIVLCSLSSGHISRKNTVGERKERREKWWFVVAVCGCGFE
jgi:hypothetical protein